MPPAGSILMRYRAAINILKLKSLCPGSVSIEQHWIRTAALRWNSWTALKHDPSWSPGSFARLQSALATDEELSSHHHLHLSDVLSCCFRLSGVIHSSVACLPSRHERLHGATPWFVRDQRARCSACPLGCSLKLVGGRAGSHATHGKMGATAKFRARSHCKV